MRDFNSTSQAMSTAHPCGSMSFDTGAKTYSTRRACTSDERYNAGMTAQHDTTITARRDKIHQVLVRLESDYGRPEWTVHRPPLDELVMTILSQHTSDTNCERAFASLRAEFPYWQQVADADEHSIAEAIRSGGLASVKAPRIKAVVAEALETNLPERLAAMPLSEAKERLQNLPGVGPKTAACVLLFACHVPALPVDTHVYRVSKRLGLIDERTSANQAHDDLEALLDDNDVYPFHVNMIRHGREICKARSPRCDDCSCASICDYAARGESR